MPDYRKTKPQQEVYHRKPRIHFTYFVALLVLIYLTAQFVLFFNRESITYVVAQEGEIMESFSAQGVIVREEQLVRASESGVVQYYYPGGKELQKGTLICTLLDDYYGDILQEKIDEIYAELQEIQGSEYDEAFVALDTSISSSIATYLRNKEVNEYGNLYRLKNDLEDAISKRKDMYSLLSNTRVASLLTQQGIYLNQQSAVVSNLYSSEAGIIDYSYDGYEGWTVEQIGPDFIKNYDSSYSYFEINMQQISSGTPLYRLISSPVWNIVIYITEEQAQYFSTRNENTGEYEIPVYSSISFVYNGVEKMSGIIRGLEKKGDNQYKLILQVNSRMQEYMNDRIVNLVFTKDSHSGLKISDSCLVQKNYYVVPSSYLISSGGERGLLVSESSGVNFKKIQIAAVINDKAYIEPSDALSPETVIQMEDSTEIMTVGEIQQVEGVYVVNGGYEQFQVVDIKYRAQGYAIVEGITQYDRIKING